MRLVLHHATGRLAGLYQILGIAPSAQDYPVTLRYEEGLTATWAAAKNGYLLYREGA